MANDHDLMQHADGELSDRDAKEVAAYLVADPAARAKAEALGELSELVRGHLELAVDAVPAAAFEAMWKSIDSATQLEGSVERARSDHAPARKSLWGSMIGWVDHHRGYFVTGLASAGAVAALAVVLRSESTTTVIQRGNAINVQPAALRVAPEIESLDVPDGEGTVLNLEDEDGHTTVIWVSPADTVEGI